MKLRGQLVDHVLLAGGKQRLTIETGDDARDLWDALREHEIQADIRRYRKPRSTDANAYFHVLVNKIAAAVGSSDEDVKKRLVLRYGALITNEEGTACGAMVPAGTDIDRFYPYARKYKTTEMNGRMYDCYLFYARTRDMNSAEMAHLIDGAIDEAKALGIETMPPDELRALEALWKGNENA